ncbi:MAG: M14 family zinc carboxypeptidase [Planctomycetota bacterium]|jgi:hypothetical protein
MILVATTLCSSLLFMQEPQDPPQVEDPGVEAALGPFAPPPIGYRSPGRIAEDLKRRAAETAAMNLVKIGLSPEGQPILVATFHGPGLLGSASPGSPEVLIVANLEGDRIAASEVAMGIIDRFAQQGSPLLDTATVHILPVANPDAMLHVLDGESAWRGAATDDDRDGMVDEDAPEDLDGDGAALWMRVYGAGGDRVADAEDPRVSREADAAEGEAGTFRLQREGSDLDGDRSENEDAKGGISLEANFPHRWTQYAVDAGAFQLSEPESRALVDFMLRHPAIQLVLVLDDEDNLAEPPQGKDSVDPQSTDPLKADADLLKVLGGRLYGEDVAIRGAVHQSGNFADWAYFQRGALVLESAVWSPPLDMKPADGTDLPKNATEEHKLLVWADAWYPEAAFRPWKSFLHPQLGETEIGGWLPLVRTNPPADLLPELTTRTADFLDGLGDAFPRISWEEVEVTALDDVGVFEVRASLVNHGLLPTMTAMGRENRRPMPLRIFLELPNGGELLVGRTPSALESLDGLGGSREFHWIYRLPADADPATLRAMSKGSGEALISLEVE